MSRVSESAAAASELDKVVVIMRHALIAIALAVCAACSPAAPTARLNENFVLSPGESTSVSGTNVSVRFLGVQGDSRCPADAVCIQGGDAIVRVEVLPSTGGATTYDLHTANSQPVRHVDVFIALVELAPYPLASRPTQPGDYRATLRVTR